MSYFNIHHHSQHQINPNLWTYFTLQLLLSGGILPETSGIGRSSSSYPGGNSFRPNAALYITESEIVLSWSRARCQLAMRPEILNNRSTEHPDAGTARTSRAIL